jgi:predicted TIM-barrel fold metal-dependent hydrolase
LSSGDEVSGNVSERPYTIISVDDHLVEPRDLFERHIPAKYRDEAPRVVMQDDRSEAWLYEGNLQPQIGLSAVAGRPVEEWSREPTRFDQMRRGCWDIHERVRDMDLGGVYASLCFPSAMAGFGGVVFGKSKDPSLGLAVTRAWNSWHLEEWAGPYPDRIIPLQIPWLGDACIAAEEIERNASRGFKAVSFPEDPAKIGLPSLHSGYWDPFVTACAETGTVLCLHVGSASGFTLRTADKAPYAIHVVNFPTYGLISATEWLWSGIPSRYPDLKIAMSEGGIGWVAMLADRSDFVLHHSGAWTTDWTSELLPSEVLRRNFWFCSIDDPSGMELRHRIGVENIMLESDYPHPDSTWPNTQEIARQRLAGLPDDEVRRITHENAAALFRHPVRQL